MAGPDTMMVWMKGWELNIAYIVTKSVGKDVENLEIPCVEYRPK